MHARVFALLALCMTASEAIAGGDALQGSRLGVESRFELFEYGDAGSGARIYPDEGLQIVEELRLDFADRPSPWEEVRGEASLLFSDSDYRSDENVDLERAQLFWEKGDIGLPFRATAGDYSAFLSYRTLLRTLKGVQLELQPDVSWMGLRPSLLAFGGSSTPTWAHGDFEDDVYAGMSVGLGAERTGAFLHAAYNRREAGTGLPDRENVVASAALDHAFALFGEPLALFAEYAAVTGDALTPAADLGDDTDHGAVIELRRDSRGAFGYRLRYERYGEAFAPGGANVPADRQSGEAHASWRFASGATLRGRAQTFRDALESGNPVDTHTFGLRLSGPVAAGVPVQSAVDGYVQWRSDRDDTIDAFTSSVRVDLQVGFGGFAFRPSLYWLREDDDVADRMMDTGQAGLAVGRRFQLGDLDLDFDVGADWRRRWGGTSDIEEIAPRASLGLAYRHHSLRGSYAYGGQSARDPLATDSTTHRLSGRYAFTWGPHELALEADYESRDSGATPRSRGSRYGLVYTFRFDKPAGTPVFPQHETAPTAPAPSPAVSDDPLLGLPPGIAIEEARRRAAAGGLAGGFEEPGLVVFESPILAAVDARQRLAIVHRAGHVERVVVIVDLERPDEPVLTLSRVEEELSRRYGAPDRTDTQPGVFPVREWDTGTGVIRLGIPDRLDGIRRVEIQHARTFGSLRNRDWSLEAVR